MRMQFESDVFILSGAEDLVPVYRKDNNENWVRDQQGNLVVHEDLIDGYRVRRTGHARKDCSLKAYSERPYVLVGCITIDAVNLSKSRVVVEGEITAILEVHLRQYSRVVIVGTIDLKAARTNRHTSGRTPS